MTTPIDLDDLDDALQLIRRAAELLTTKLNARIPHEQWAKERDQWLKDAGINE